MIGSPCLRENPSMLIAGSFDTRNNEGRGGGGGGALCQSMTIASSSQASSLVLQSNFYTRTEIFEFLDLENCQTAAGISDFPIRGLVPDEFLFEGDNRLESFTRGTIQETEAFVSIAPCEVVKSLPEIVKMSEVDGATHEIVPADTLGAGSDWELLSIEDVMSIFMKDKGLPSVECCVCILKRCREERHLPFAKQAYTHICSSGLESLRTLGSHVLHMFAQCGCVSIAQQVFNTLPNRYEYSWTSLILGYVQDRKSSHTLNLYYEMQQDSVVIRSYTLVALLKGCTGPEDVRRGRDIHFEVAQKGLEGDLFVGNSLVGMYTRCGLLLEAHDVFYKLPCQDVISWTTLIVGYTEFGHDKEVFKCLQGMSLNGIPPSDVTFACGLKACSNFGALDKGREIHMEVVCKGYEGHLCVSNTLVGMYAKCGLLSEAQKIFKELPVRDVVSWTALIAGYAEHGLGQEALLYYENMKCENVSPNAVTCACVLKACACLEALDKGQELHTEITQKGFGKDSFVENSLLDMYAKCGSLSEAEEIFHMLISRDAVAWTALITGYTEHGPVQEALNCFQQMKLEGVLPDVFTYACLLKACNCGEAITLGRELHLEVFERGFLTDLPVSNALIDMYVKSGSLLEAQEVFDNMLVRDVVSWTTLMVGYAEDGNEQEVLRCYDKMQQEGVVPNEVTLACFLRACGSTGALNKGRQIHKQITPKGLEADFSIANSLIGMYGKCGLLSEAEEIFGKMPVRQVGLWSSMIKCYGLNHEGGMAIQCFEDMLVQGVEPDAVTFTCLLTACSHASLVRKGREYFKMMIGDYDIMPNLEHLTCIVGLLSRAGHLYEAETLIEMYCPLIQQTWAALLSGCKTYGEEALGHRCFLQLVQINTDIAAWYVLMADIYASAGRRLDAYQVDQLRKHGGVAKKPASATIEVDGTVHEFTIGGNHSDDISLMLVTLRSRMRTQGHVPNFDLVLKPISDEAKEAVLCEHAEKVAIAFGILNTPQGATLRVNKNMRMCSDCHNMGKIVSKVERREIILRDDCCIHHFKEGLCSCGDMF